MDEGINRKQIMVVDDESDLTLYYRMSLEYYGFTVDTFNEPKEALSNFKPNHYDLVILDILMRDMDGFELYREIKKIDPTINACFLTASDPFYERFRDKEYDSLDKESFIRKPIENEELIEKIKWLISKQCNT
jgi:DNA-binding response OmpR family regulator